jgi:Helix-turn-helix domain
MAAPNGRSSLEIFARLIRDNRISHGAFRLWHCLRDYTDHASRCFPGQRRLSDDIGCKIHSLKQWTHELVAAGWLEVESHGPSGGFDYTVLDGNGQPMRKPEPTVAPNGNAHRCLNRQWGVGQTGHGVLPIPATKVSSPINPDITRPDADLPVWFEIKAEADMRGVPEASARRFFDHHESNSLWLNRYGRLINWKFKLLAWASQDREKGNQNHATNRDNTFSRPNPRNVGVIQGPTNYANARPRAQREREDRETGGVDCEMAANDRDASSNQCGAGSDA